MPVGPQALPLGNWEIVLMSSSSVIGDVREEYHSELMWGSGWYCCFQKLSNRGWLIGLYEVQFWKWFCMCSLISLGSVISWLGSLILEKWIGEWYLFRILLIA